MGKATVLVVDDDQAIVDFLEEALIIEGYDVLSAVAEPAVHLAHDRQPNVILLDIMMPDMDGFEVSKRLRADPHTAGIPIIVMSANERLNSAKVLMHANDSLLKPFPLEGLYAKVERWATPA